MNAVPFTVGHLYAGFGQCDGLLQDEDDHLDLEFQIKNALAGSSRPASGRPASRSQI
jgi:hypothetical protein